MTAGTLAALAAKQATRTLPIVFASAADPVTDGLVISLAGPGGNVTGPSNLTPELLGKCLEQLTQGVPGVSRVAVLLQPGSLGERTEQDMLKRAGVAARALRVRLQVVAARGPADFDRAFSDMTRERAGALTVLPIALFVNERRRLVDLAAKHRLPAVYPGRDFVDAGGLMSYGPNLADLFRRAATYVDKILKSAKPADLPVEQPTKFELVINRASREADVFSGSQSRRGKSQSPVTRVAGWRETETLKPTDQAIERMVSESPGRNGSERTGGPEILKPRRPSLTVERRRQHGTSHLADAAGRSGGVIATAR